MYLRVRPTLIWLCSLATKADTTKTAATIALASNVISRRASPRLNVTVALVRSLSNLLLLNRCFWCPVPFFWQWQLSPPVRACCVASFNVYLRHRACTYWPHTQSIAAMLRTWGVRHLSQTSSYFVVAFLPIVSLFFCPFTFLARLRLNEWLFVCCVGVTLYYLMFVGAFPCRSFLPPLASCRMAHPVSSPSCWLAASTCSLVTKNSFSSISSNTS